MLLTPVSYQEILAHAIHSLPHSLGPAHSWLSASHLMTPGVPSRSWLTATHSERLLVQSCLDSPMGIHQEFQAGIVQYNPGSTISSLSMQGTLTSFVVFTFTGVRTRIPYPVASEHRWLVKAPRWIHSVPDVSDRRSWRRGCHARLWNLHDVTKRQCRRKQRLYNRAKKSGKAGHKAAYIRARKSVQSALKQARWGYINGILQAGLDEGTSKPFWGYIRQQRQDNVGVSPLKKDGKLHADSLSRCEILASQFKSVFTKDSDDPLRDIALFGPSYPPIDPLIIREEGIRKLLSGVNPSKAAGPDQVPCRLLKELSNELSPIFTYLFKQSLATGKLPSFWHTAWVTPVFKKGPRNLPENYRPVSLTCVVCKLMEHVVSSHIRSHLDKHGILTPYNHGFSAGCSCESQLLLTTHDMYRKLDQQGSQVDVAVLDFSKILYRIKGYCGSSGSAASTGTSIHGSASSCVTGHKV